MVASDTSSRHIYWVFGRTGGEGKTELCRHWVINVKDTLVIEGKASDMKYAIATRIENGESYPKLVVMNIARQ